MRGLFLHLAGKKDMGRLHALGKSMSCGAGYEPPPVLFLCLMVHAYFVYTGSHRLLTYTSSQQVREPSSAVHIQLALSQDKASIMALNGIAR